MSIRTDETEKKVIQDKLLGDDSSYAGAASFNGAESGLVNTQMLDSLDKMNRTAVNRSYRDIPASGLGQKLSRMVKRLMRRLTFWYVEPCMQQQTEYNSAAAAFSAQANSEINRLKCENNSLKKELELISGRLDGYSAAESENTARLNELSDRLGLLYSDIANNMSDRVNRLEAQLNESVSRNMSTLTQKVASIDVSLRRMNMKFSAAQDTEGEQVIYDGSDAAFESFSQSGEDAVIRHVLSDMRCKLSEISYLDLGANHAKFLSNTYAFYCYGARGVLVEANPHLIDELRQHRSEDIILNRCISDKNDELVTFYIMNGDGLSTMDYEAAVAFTEENPMIKIERTETVKTITVNDIINEYFSGKAPEILNVDIEGMELEVLGMIDFDSFRPLIIICEMIEYKSTFGIPEKNGEILRFMEEHGYSEYAFTGINSIFIDRKALGGS